MDIPNDTLPVCPVCENEYESVSVHEEGIMIGLAENERYRRVCIDPERRDGEPVLYFYHHTHDQTAPPQADAESAGTS